MAGGPGSRLPLSVLCPSACPQAKASLTHSAFAALVAGRLPLGSDAAPDAPARPARPELVPVKQARAAPAPASPLASRLPARRSSCRLTPPPWTDIRPQVPTAAEWPHVPMSVHVLHNLAHIELNAIDLAWDTVVRFSARHPTPEAAPPAPQHSPSLPRFPSRPPCPARPPSTRLAATAVHSPFSTQHSSLRPPDPRTRPPLGAQHLHPQLPSGFFEDFARVADDESRHLGWCLQRLRELGHDYGDIPAHNRLWDAAQSTARDLHDRLVIVPCVQEARGLDAGGRLADRLASAGDRRSADIVRRIAEEERAHVVRRGYLSCVLLSSAEQPTGVDLHRWHLPLRCAQAVGVAWLRALCSRDGREPGVVFQEAVARHIPDGLRGPFNDRGACRISRWLLRWADVN